MTIKSTRPAGELLFKHEFIIINLALTFAREIFELYHQRAIMEDLIKEVKSCFDFEKKDNSGLWLTTLECCLSVWLIT